MYLIESWVSLGLLNVCIVWISLILLCSKVLATFADHICLLHFLTISWWTKETAMISFKEDKCVGLTIVFLTRLTHTGHSRLLIMLLGLLCVAKLLIRHTCTRAAYYIIDL